MECTKVTKIKVNDSIDPYHLITYWKDDFLRFCLINKDEYWSGNFLSSEFKHFYENLCISEEKYITNLKEAFDSNNQNCKFMYNFNDCVFKWKVTDDTNIGIIYGKCKLNEHIKKGGNELLIDTLLALNKSNEEMIRNQQNEILELGRQVRICIEKCQEFSEIKKKMELEIYCKFTQLINTKKQKISDLHEFFSDGNLGPNIHSPDSSRILPSTSNSLSNAHRMSESDSND